MLFPSTLIVSGQSPSLEPYLKELGHQNLINNPDIFLVSEKEDYTVENIRQIKKFLSQNPYSHTSKIVIIQNADLLNIESQNTLLKNLEEPGANNYFILTTPNPASILPTVVSRCSVLRLTSNQISTQKTLTFPNSIPESLSLTESFVVNKSSVLPFLEAQLGLYQKLLVKDPSLKNIATIKKISKAIQMLGANIDSKNVLDFLFLS